MIDSEAQYEIEQLKNEIEALRERCIQQDRLTLRLEEYEDLWKTFYLQYGQYTFREIDQFISHVMDEMQKEKGL